MEMILKHKKITLCFGLYLLFCFLFAYLTSLPAFHHFIIQQLELYYSIKLTKDYEALYFSLARLPRFSLILILAGIAFLIFKFKHFEKFSSRQTFYFVFLCFSISFALRFFINDYAKIFIIYPDEMRYFLIAKNLAEGQGILIYNLPTNFQKIVYPFFLIPAFLFENQAIQQFIFNLTHCFLMSSSIFPIFLIAKKLLKTRQYIFGITLFSIFLPDLNYTQTFMSENCFLPFALWIFYAFLLLINTTKTAIIPAFFIGVFTYFLYGCKEIALVFPFGFAVYILMAYLLKIKTSFKTDILNSIFVFVGFFFCFILFKITLFSGLGNSYKEMPLNVLFESQRLNYLFYSFFYYFVNIILAGGFFVVLLPLVYFNHLGLTLKKSILFLLILLFLSAIIVAYAAFIREDFFFLTKNNPRTLFRYVLYAWILFLIHFVALFETQLSSPSLKTSLFFIVPLLWICFYYLGVADFSFVEQNTLHYLLPWFDTDTPPFLLFLFKTLLVLTSILILWNIYGPKHRAGSVLSMVLMVFCCLQIINNARPIVMMPFKYAVFPHEALTMQKLAQFIHHHPQQNFLILGEVPTRTQSLADNFLYSPNLATIRVRTFLDLQASSPLLFSHVRLPVLAKSLQMDWSTPVPKTYAFSQIHFLLLPKMFPLHLENAHLRTDLSNAYFDVYENANPFAWPNLIWLNSPR